VVTGDLVVTVVALLVVVGSGGFGSGRSGASVPAPVPAPHVDAAVGTVGAPGLGRGGAPGAEVLTGPLDWGDPVIIESGGAYYLYSTQPLPWVNVPVEVGARGGSWGPVHDALPALPPWAQSGQTWAPEVHRFAGRWVLYFAAWVRGTDPAVHCIGDAVADGPTGPFLPGAVPLVCQRSSGGSIDPRVYVAPSGSPYLVWKSDNNSDPARYGPPVIWTQPLSGDGLGLVGSPTSIFSADRAWQHSLVEAPDLVTVGGRTWLFYSGGGGYSATDYAIGVAHCAGPTGPCRDVVDAPLLATNAQGEGPGESSVFSQGAHHWLVYNPSRSAPGSAARPVALAPLVFGAGPPVVDPAGPPPREPAPRP